MLSFKDTEGRSWDLTLSIGDIKRVKSLTGVDLLDAKEGKILSDLATDPITTVDVLFAICKPEAETRGISDEAFGAALDGDAVRKAIDAFIEALVDFFLRFQPTTGAVLKALWERLGEADRKAGEIAKKRIESEIVGQIVEKQLQKAEMEVDASLKKILGNLSSS